jgi:hypothetical protein
MIVSNMPATCQALVTNEAHAPASAAPDVVAVEFALWESVKDSDKPAMYEAYLKHYPNGPCGVG